MEIREVIKGRRSIRKYKADEVSEKIIREIIEDAPAGRPRAVIRNRGSYM